MFDIDPERVGWPWAEGTFSWVEPTAWAVLALRAAGHGEHPRVDRRRSACCSTGRSTPAGINYGNRLVLGAMTEPIPGPTAMMLLALQGHDEPRVQAASRYLARHGRADDRPRAPRLGEARPDLPRRRRRSRGVPAEARRAHSHRVRRANSRRPAGQRDPPCAHGAGPWQRTSSSASAQAATRPGRSRPRATRCRRPRRKTRRGRGLVERIKGKFRNMVVRGLGALRQPPAFGPSTSPAPNRLRRRPRRRPQDASSSTSARTCRSRASASC